MPYRIWLTAIGLAFALASPSAQADTLSKNPEALLVEFAESVTERHFDVHAARKELAAARSRQEAAAQPLYNPQLSLEAENGGEGEAIGRTVSKLGLGVSQSFDWSDKREVRALAAQNDVRAAKAQLTLAEQEIAANALDALINYRTSRQLLELANHRVEVLRRFKDLAENRKRTGDIGQTDLDLARLALAEGQSELAENRFQANEALQNIRKITSTPPESWPGLPDRLPPPRGTDALDELSKRHPKIIALRSKLAAAEAEIDVAKSQRRADPTIGADLSREGKNNIVGFSVSMPLYVRNSFRAEVDAAANNALAVEARMHAEYERLQASLKTALENYQYSRGALEDWDLAVGGRIDEGLELLERLWKVGELSATDYLLQIQQRLDTRASGLRLKAQTWKSWTNWLVASGDWQAELARLGI
jgi:outer membrane protein, heavy metal efflux system